MKPVVILIEDLFNEHELLYPYYRVQEAGYPALLTGPEARVYKSKAGLAMRAEAAAGEVDPKEVLGLVVPGGYAPDRLRRHKEVLDLVRAVDAAKKPIAAICHAGWVLISAGIVRGRRLTGYFSIKDDLINAGAVFLDEAPVVDGNLVTARGPGDIPRWLPPFLELLGQAGAA